MTAGIEQSSPEARIHKTNLVLLPGLDGTGLLFKPLLEVIPSCFTPLVISYPSDEPLDYDALLSCAQSLIPLDQPFVIVAESFSGPIAVRIAATRPNNLRALILCASFVSNPTLLSNPLTSFLINTPVFNVRPPDFLVRYFLMGQDAPVDLMNLFKEALDVVSPSVLASRLQIILEVNERDSLRKCQVPVLYIAAKHDKLVSPRSLTEITRIKPNVESIFIDAPHFLLQCKPQLAIEIINEYLIRNAITDKASFQ